MILPLKVAHHNSIHQDSKQLDMQLKIIGFEQGDIGSHYCRKGVATMVFTGCTVYPPISALCIWYGLVLGGVKDKYIFSEKSSDEYVGRCASFLYQIKKEFAVSPPYLDFTELCEIEKLDCNRQFFSS